MNERRSHERESEPRDRDGTQLLTHRPLLSSIELEAGELNFMTILSPALSPLTRQEREEPTPLEPESDQILAEAQLFSLCFLFFASSLLFVSLRQPLNSAY